MQTFYAEIRIVREDGLFWVVGLKTVASSFREAVEKFNCWMHAGAIFSACEFHVERVSVTA